MGSVKLRRKKIKAGISLYLDIYNKGVRKTEFLNLYHEESPKTAIAKQQKKDVLKLAESIMAKRLLELQQNDYDLTPVYKAKTIFIDYFEILFRDRKRSGKNFPTWQSVRKHLINFLDGKPIYLSDINTDFIKGFRQHLLDKVKINSASSYFNVFVHVLHQAYRDKYIKENIALNVEFIKNEETQRNYLTMEEVQALANTECARPELKRAFLFSCFTGLRFSDIHKLTWSDIHTSKTEHWTISFRQKKTKGFEYLPISEQAQELLGKSQSGDIKVFNIKYNVWENTILKQWVLKAGITKNITFHSARHTNATMLLNYGNDIFLVQKLLGHKNIKTTEIYAKIIDANKVNAVNSLPKIKFGN